MIIDNKSKNAEETLKDIANQKIVGKCLYCEEVKPICNSHHIPLVFLKSIGDGGYFTSSGILKKKIKHGSVNTFNLICSDCDVKLFTKYENTKTYSKNSNPASFLDSETLKQIAIKNYLKVINDVKHHAYKKLDEFIIEKYEVAKDHLEIIKSNGTVFCLDSARILDYVIPYVCHDFFVLENYVCHVCCFPFTNFSVVFEFSNYFGGVSQNAIEFLDDDILWEINGGIIGYNLSAYVSRTLNVQDLSENETYPNYLLKEYSLKQN